MFVNCCHLAPTTRTLLFEPTNYDRARFASGVAEALIEIGVRCVIAAGWAVDDDAASVFAATFYEALLGGDRFIDAVAAAREAARSKRRQHLGGLPVLRRSGLALQDADRRRADAPAATRRAGIFRHRVSLWRFILALERIAVESEYQGKKPEDQAARLRYLEATFAKYWEKRGNVAEAFGNAWSKSRGFEEAIDWYERARRAQDGTASFASIEQMANAKIRLAWERAAGDDTAIDRARDDIKDAMDLLGTLIALAPTVERESLYGSGYKRLALVEAAAARLADKPDAKAAAEAAEEEAIEQMRAHYGAAETIARESPAAPAQPLFYPAMNRIAAQLSLADDEKRSAAMDRDTIALVRNSMLSAPPDFWSVVGQTELDMYVSIAAGTLARDADA